MYYCEDFEKYRDVQNMRVLFVSTVEIFLNV